MTASRGTALVVDDHELFRIALSSILTSQLGFPRVLQASCIEEALQALDRHGDIGLVTLDLCMPGVQDVGVFSLVREAYPVPILVAVSGSATHGDAVSCVRAGANAFIPKALSAEEIAAALVKVVAGEVFVPTPDPARKALYLDDETRPRIVRAGTGAERLRLLTPRQTEVHALLLGGLSNKEIARRLGLSDNTVKVHAFAICRLFGVSDRRDLARASA